MYETRIHTYVVQTETRAERIVDWDSSRHVAVANLSPFFIYGEFVRTLLDVCSLAREQRSFDRSTHVLSTRSRVEIDKCRVRTSITYLTGALDSFGVKKSLRFPAQYQRSLFSLLFLFVPLAVSHNGLESRSISNAVESAGELSPLFKGRWSNDSR